MLRHIAAAGALTTALTLSLSGQGAVPAKKLSFEVASIKPTKERLPGPMWSGGARQTVVTGLTPFMMIRGAYDLRENEVLDAPGWAHSEQYDISAAYEGQRSSAQHNEMMQSLLEERFALKAHFETREAPTYRAVLSRQDGKLGSNLAASTVACDTAGRARPCGMRASSGTVSLSGYSVRYLLNYLESVVGRRIIDETGLKGEYEITLEWARGRDDLDRPSVFTALQEQLGLRLEPARGPVQVLIIDSISRPTPD
jgi:uncharacterized protein (TIGR03435 family)